MLSNFECCLELRFVKTFALKLGFKFCAGKYLVTCDDDNYLYSDYLIKTEAILSQDPQIGVIGGYGVIKSDNDIDDWVYSFQRYYACGAQHYQEGEITHTGSIWGAGMIFDAVQFRKFLKAGFKNILTCRKGTELTSGGDIEYCRWFLLAGKKLWYSHDLKYEHFIPSSRLSVNYIKRLENSFEQVSETIYKYDALIQNKNYGLFKGLYYMLKWILGKDTKFTLVNLELSFFSKFHTFDKETKAIKSGITNLPFD